MNRLILVGNGFDLAHGMKTGYNDFIVWYFKKTMENGKGRQEYDDQLIHIRNTAGPGMHFYDAGPQLPKPSEMSISEFVDYCYANDLLFRFVQNTESVVPKGRTFNYQYSVQVKSRLLVRLLENCSAKKWVEIENEYYELLKDTLHHNMATWVKKEVPIINADMAFLIQQLHDYLAQLPPPPEVQGYGSIIRREFSSNAMPLLKEGTVISPDKIYVLNFNYTSTVEQYIKYAGNAEVTYIHGKLNDSANPLIFGFGDELDDEYVLMERSKIKGFFKYIKSFWYFRTSHYHHLLRFLESDDFELVVLGHSCGLSDRTMLSMIFNHGRCKGIRIYYYQNGAYNDYTDKTEEISRHFTDKGLMRKKVISLPFCEAMPQYVKIATLGEQNGEQ